MDLTDIELINELKRLSSVVSELQTTNVRLTNLVSELQDQNSNLINNINDLQAINTKLVEVNIRALSKEDTPQIGLPYDLISLSETNSTELISVNSYTFRFADSGLSGDRNWGEGLDFYPMFLIIGGQTKDNPASFPPLTYMGECFRILVYEYWGTGSITMFRERYTLENLPLFYRGSNNYGTFWITRNIYGNKVNSENELRVAFENAGKIDDVYGYKVIFEANALKCIVTGIVKG